MTSIKHLRKQQRLTLKALADKTGLALKLINKYELGTVDPPSSKLLRIAEALGVPVCRLFDANGTTPPSCQEHPHA